MILCNFADARDGDLSNSVKNGILYLEDPLDQVSCSITKNKHNMFSGGVRVLQTLQQLRSDGERTSV